MSGMIYLKHYTNKRHDPRVKLLTLPSKGIYYMLAEVAGQCDSDGAFVMNGIQLNDQQIAHLIAVDVKELKTAFREMKRTGIVSVNGHGPYLTDFADEQMAQSKRQEKWNEYQQRSREKKKDVNTDIDTDISKDVNTDVNALELRVKSIELRVSSLLSSEELKSVKPGWIAEAATIAEKAGKPATYAKGIIRNWIKEGKNKQHAAHKPSRRETPKPTAEPAKPNDATLKAAQRALAKRRTKSNV